MKTFFPELPSTDNKRDEFSDELYRPIPLDAGKVDGWKEVQMKSYRWRRDPLVPLGLFSDYSDIFTSSVYYGEHSSSPYRSRVIKGETLMTQFVRQSTAERLRNAQSLLPQHHYLLVFDAYRSTTVQSSLYESFVTELRKQRPEMSEDQLSAEAQKYVSAPSRDKKVPAPHNTGGSVDVGIVRLDEASSKRVTQIDAVLHRIGRPGSDMVYGLEMERASLMRGARLLDFGTSFDEMATSAHLTALEGETGEATLNRRLLNNAMTAVGFSSYEYEWWHFNDIATQMGARALGLTVATMGGTRLSRKNQNHEKMRRQHYFGVNVINDHLDQLIGRDDLPKHVALVAITQASHGGIIEMPGVPSAIRISPDSKGA